MAMMAVISGDAILSPSEALMCSLASLGFHTVSYFSTVHCESFNRNPFCPAPPPPACLPDCSVCSFGRTSAFCLNSFLMLARSRTGTR